MQRDPAAVHRKRTGGRENLLYALHSHHKRTCGIGQHQRATYPVSEMLKEMEERMGKLPKYIGADVGYHDAWNALNEKNRTHILGHHGKVPFI